MPGVKGNAKIIVQPGTLNMGYRIHSDIQSSETADDGFIPYNCTITGATITVKTADGTVDTELVAATSVSSPNIDIALSYPTTNGFGRYYLSFIVTFSNGTKDEFDLNRVYVEDQ